MKFFIIILILFMLITSCSTLRNNWEVMDKRQVIFEKTLLVLTGVSAALWTKNFVYSLNLPAITEEMTKEAP